MNEFSRSEGSHANGGGIAFGPTGLIGGDSPSDCEVRSGKSVRLGTVIRELFKLLRATLPSGIQLRHEIVTHEDWVSSDGAELRKAFLNLATCACPVMQFSGGTINFLLELEDVDGDLVAEAASAQKFLRLTITATQCVPWETLGQLFEPKPVAKGNAGGLQVVHEIVTRHGGSICAESLPGQGTTFTVLLPRAFPARGGARKEVGAGKVAV
jgi:two-component system, cell cycle sensor histidine kinase and response regulator CckA